MSRLSIIILTIICMLFVVSWVLNAETEGNFGAFKLTLGAFLTLAIMSFLYRDNNYYKFAEHLFVGISAAYWMCMGFWSTFVQNLLPRLSNSLADYFQVPRQEGEMFLDLFNLDVLYIIPVILGVMLLMRLLPNVGWLARWPLAFIVGTTAGLNFIRFLRSDFIKQVEATFIPLVNDWNGFGAFFADFSLNADSQFIAMLSNIVIFIGVMCGLIYFYFSKEHTGWFGKASRVGIWILMVTFGASFGYTVMGRISLLVGRLNFLLGDWLGLIS